MKLRIRSSDDGHCTRLATISACNRLFVFTKSSVTARINAGQMYCSDLGAVFWCILGLELGMFEHKVPPNGRFSRPLETCTNDVICNCKLSEIHFKSSYRLEALVSAKLVRQLFHKWPDSVVQAELTWG